MKIISESIKLSKINSYTFFTALRCPRSSNFLIIASSFIFTNQIPYLELEIITYLNVLLFFSKITIYISTNLQKTIIKIEIIKNRAIRKTASCCSFIFISNKAKEFTLMSTKTNMKIKKEKKRKRRIQSNGWLNLSVFLMYLMYFNLQNISLEVSNIFFISAEILLVVSLTPFS